VIQCLLLRSSSRQCKLVVYGAVRCAMLLVTQPPDSCCGATGRVHPLERAAAAAQQRGQRSEAFADSYDALLFGVEAEVAAPQPLWRLAYQALRLRRLVGQSYPAFWLALAACGFALWGGNGALVPGCRLAGAAGCGVLLGCAVCG
jgi:hypothetical protein